MDCPLRTPLLHHVSGQYHCRFRFHDISFSLAWKTLDFQPHIRFNSGLTSLLIQPLHWYHLTFCLKNLQKHIGIIPDFTKKGNLAANWMLLAKWLYAKLGYIGGSLFSVHGSGCSRFCNTQELPQLLILIAAEMSEPLLQFLDAIVWQALNVEMDSRSKAANHLSLNTIMSSGLTAWKWLNA